MIAIALLSGLAVALSVAALWKILGPEGSFKMRQQVRERIFKSGGSHHGLAFPTSIEKKPYIGKVKAFQNVLSGYEFTQKIADLLRRSRLNVSVSLFLLSSFSLGICSLALSIHFLRAFFAIPFAILMGFVPFFYLRWRSNRYLLKFTEYLPNALSTIKNAIKVGHGLEAAIEAVVQTVPYPVSDEFRTVQTEMKLGQSLEVALQNLYQRIQTPETKIFVTGVNIHEELGGNLSEILDNLESTVRERFALQREIKALSAQGVMSSYVLCAVPFVMTAVWFFNDPAALKEFVYSQAGKTGITIAIFCQLTAFLWMRRVIQIKD